MDAHSGRGRWRCASHAGTWYSAKPAELTGQMESWLAAVEPLAAAGQPPRAVIGPHAGFAYSGPTAAHAYRHIVRILNENRCLMCMHARCSDPLGLCCRYQKAFRECLSSGLLITSTCALAVVRAHDTLWFYPRPRACCGIASHAPADGELLILMCALVCPATSCAAYDTPFGPLAVDTETLAALGSTGHFESMSKKVDEAEHSLELHLRTYPLGLNACSLTQLTLRVRPCVLSCDWTAFVAHLFAGREIKIVPIMVGALTPALESLCKKRHCPSICKLSLFSC